MAKGEVCRGKACENIQPCPEHTTRGKPRKVSRAGVTDMSNVHTLFTDEKQNHSNGLRPAGGKRTKKGEGEGEEPRTARFVKQRVGKRWSQIHDEVSRGMYTWDEFVEELDAEELARAQLKADDGTFRGRPPEFIPRAFYLACQREMIGRFNHSMQSNLEKATNELIKLATDPDIMEAKDRAKWLQYIIERVVGKIPDKVEVKAADPWETIIGDILSEAPEGVTVPQYIANRTEGEGE